MQAKQLCRQSSELLNSVTPSGFASFGILQPDKPYIIPFIWLWLDSLSLDNIILLRSRGNTTMNDTITRDILFAKLVKLQIDWIGDLPADLQNEKWSRKEHPQCWIYSGWWRYDDDE